MQLLVLALFVCAIKAIGITLILTDHKVNMVEFYVNLCLRGMIILSIIAFILRIHKLMISELIEIQYAVVNLVGLTIFTCLIGISLFEIIIYNSEYIKIQYLE